MLWTLRELVERCAHTQANINGKWVPARPIGKPGPSRLKCAWLVLTGKADAFTWPEGQ